MGVEARSAVFIKLHFLEGGRPGYLCVSAVVLAGLQGVWCFGSRSPKNPITVRQKIGRFETQSSLDTHRYENYYLCTAPAL